MTCSCAHAVLLFIPGCGGGIAWTAISLQLSRQATRWPESGDHFHFGVTALVFQAAGVSITIWVGTVSSISGRGGLSAQIGCQLLLGWDPNFVAMLTQHVCEGLRKALESRAQQVPKAWGISDSNLEVWGFVSRSLSIGPAWTWFSNRCNWLRWGLAPKSTHAAFRDSSCHGVGEPSALGSAAVVVATGQIWQRTAHYMRCRM